MDKPKYDKPVAKDLSSIQIAHGSCKSGSPEHTVTGGCIRNGQVALNRCGPGGIVYPVVSCGPGSEAGTDCATGYGAF